MKRRGEQVVDPVGGAECLELPTTELWTVVRDENLREPFKGENLGQRRNCEGGRHGVAFEDKGKMGVGVSDEKPVETEEGSCIINMDSFPGIGSGGPGLIYLRPERLVTGTLGAPFDHVFDCCRQTPPEHVSPCQRFGPGHSPVSVVEHPQDRVLEWRWNDDPRRGGGLKAEEHPVDHGQLVSDAEVEFEVGGGLWGRRWWPPRSCIPADRGQEIVSCRGVGDLARCDGETI